MLAVLFCFSLLLKAEREPNRAIPCVLGDLSNINSIKLKMEKEQSTDSSRQEACWGPGSKGQAGRNRCTEPENMSGKLHTLRFCIQSDSCHSAAYKSTPPYTHTHTISLLHPCMHSVLTSNSFQPRFHGAPPSTCFSCMSYS